MHIQLHISSEKRERGGKLEFIDQGCYCYDLHVNKQYFSQQWNRAKWYETVVHQEKEKNLKTDVCLICIGEEIC